MVRGYKSSHFYVYGQFQIGNKTFGWDDKYYLRYDEKFKFKRNWTYVMYNLDCPRPLKGYKYRDPRQFTSMLVSIWFTRRGVDGTMLPIVL